MRDVKNTIQEFANKFGYEVRKKQTWKTYEWLANEGIKTVFDVGANIGQFAKHIHRIIPDAQIYSFEPLKNCFEGLKLTVKDIPGISCFNYALGQENGVHTIYHNDFTPSSSMLQMMQLHRDAFPNTKNTTEEYIETHRLDDITVSLELIEKILIKIDVQGFEERVILGGEATIKRAQVMIVETCFEPLYHGQLLFDGIYSLLISMGFILKSIEEPLRHPKDGRVLACDCVFYRGG